MLGWEEVAVPDESDSRGMENMKTVQAKIPPTPSM